MRIFNIAIAEHRTSKPQLPRNSSQRLSLSTFPQSFTHCRYTIPASPKREVTPHTRPQIVSSCVTLPVSTGPGLLPRGNLQKPVADHSVHTDRRDAQTLCSSLGLDLGVQRERVKVSLLVGGCNAELEGATQVIMVTVRLLRCIGLATCPSSLISVQPHFRIRPSLIWPLPHPCGHSLSIRTDLLYVWLFWLSLLSSPV